MKQSEYCAIFFSVLYKASCVNKRIINFKMCFCVKLEFMAFKYLLMHAGYGYSLLFTSF